MREKQTVLEVELICTAIFLFTSRRQKRKKTPWTDNWLQCFQKDGLSYPRMILETCGRSLRRSLKKTNKPAPGGGATQRQRNIFIKSHYNSNSAPSCQTGILRAGRETTLIRCCLNKVPSIYFRKFPCEI